MMEFVRRYEDGDPELPRDRTYKFFRSNVGQVATGIPSGCNAVTYCIGISIK